ncbi:MAG: flagellar hook-length control protein FliK [Myxococcota bacterium]
MAATGEDDLAPEGATQPEVQALDEEASDLLVGFYEPTPPPLSAPRDALEPRAPEPDEPDLEWVEDDDSGDGPFPVDAQAQPRPNAFTSAGPWVPRSESFTAQPAPEVRMERRMRARADAPPQPTSHSRRYPRFRALLRHPERVPDGSEPIPEPRPPPVPGTFIPNPPPPPPRTEPTELDAMLALMADGLFIREGEDGATEVRVTLRDEYFAGTELRIGLEAGRVRATLVPPSREVYWQLSGEAHQLRDRLEQRGLRVSELSVLEPST